MEHCKLSGAAHLNILECMGSKFSPWLHRFAFSTETAQHAQVQHILDACVAHQGSQQLWSFGNVQAADQPRVCESTTLKFQKHSSAIQALL